MATIMYMTKMEMLFYTLGKGSFGSYIDDNKFINRNLYWIEDIMDADNIAGLFPEHFRNKIVK